MGTPTQIYVDPAIAADSGTGTIGDPYGDLQYALNTATRDATNGDQFNVKAGTSEILAAALSWTTYGTPTATAPCIIRGYTSAANDGGQGVVSGNGSVACITSSALDHIKLIDMRFTNCGGNLIISLDANILMLNCEIDTGTNGGAILGGNSHVINCYFHNTTSTGVQLGNGSVAAFCTFRNETNDFVRGVHINNTNCAVIFNLFDLDGASVGINVNGSTQFIAFNSIYSNGGTGKGIANATSTHTDVVIINNTVAGFSGAGGMGIQITSQNANLYGYNLAYNNTTNYSITGDVNVDLGNNDTAGAIPFVDAPNDDFDPIAGLFASYPSYPTTWKNYTATQQNLIRMAAQYAAAAAAGGLIRHPGMAGGLNG